MLFGNVDTALFFKSMLSQCDDVRILSSDSRSIEFSVSFIRSNFFDILKVISDNGYCVSVFPSHRLSSSSVDFFGESKKVDECLRVYIVKC